MHLVRWLIIMTQQEKNRLEEHEHKGVILIKDVFYVSCFNTDNMTLVWKVAQNIRLNIINMLQISLKITANLVQSGITIRIICFTWKLCQNSATYTSLKFRQCFQIRAVYADHLIHTYSNTLVSSSIVFPFLITLYQCKSPSSVTVQHCLQLAGNRLLSPTKL